MRQPPRRSALGIVGARSLFSIFSKIFPPMNARRPNRKKDRSALLGLAFDAEDGHKRITRGPNFLLAGGSQETHGVMRETAVKINEHLDRKGKQLSDMSPGEFRDIVGEIHGGSAN